jgi:hypothetical protein
MFKSIPECLIRRTKYTNIGSDIGTTWEEGGVLYMKLPIIVETNTKATTRNKRT